MTKETPIAKAQAVVRARRASQGLSIKEQVVEILADPGVDEELKRKLAYAQRQIDLGGENLALMIDVRKGLFRQLNRSDTVGP